MVHGIIAMQHSSERPKWWWWVFIAALAAFFITMPFHLEIFVILEMSRFFGMAMLALSMGFLWGFSGILSFGQTAFFGLGGYGFAVLALNTGETTGSVFFAVALGAAGAGILGYFMIYGRISEIYLSVITLVFTLILEKGIRATSGDQYVIGKVRLNGQNGIPTVPQLDVPWNPSVQLDINWFFWVGAVLMILVYIGLRLILTTPFGRVLVGIRENERRTELLGYDTRRYKLAAFMLAGGVAGLGGALYAISIPLAHPEMFSLGRAADVIMWVLGRRQGDAHRADRGRLRHRAFQGLARYPGRGPGHAGAGRGADPLRPGLPAGPRCRASAPCRASGWTARPLGERLAEFAQRLTWISRGPAAPGRAAKPGKTVVSEAVRQDDVILETRALEKRFGGVSAIAGVDFALRRGELRCLIGPNGAGKSTFFKMLTAQIRPSRGQVLFDGRDISRAHPHEISRLGIGIKNQVPDVYDGITVEENLWLAAHFRHGARAARAKVDETLARLDLVDIRCQLLGALAHGQRQWVEFGMVMALDPEIILLDEPTAGMSIEETNRTAALIREANRTTTIVVVEHDMQFIRQIADIVTVFHQGRILAEDTMARIQANQAVREVYLGTSGLA